MKILNIKQIKKNVYEVEVEKENPFLLFDETILKYNLLKGKFLDEKLIDEIKKYNKLMKCYFMVLKKLKAKLRTKNEIIQMLENEDIDESSINEVIKKLENISLINDDKYITAFINDQINLTLNGPLKIKRELLKKGVDTNKIDLNLSEIEDKIWTSRVNKIVTKKVKINRKYSNKELKNKLKQYLFNLGYNYDFVIEEFDDCDNLNKEYEKLLKKYSRKIEDKKELNQKISNNLYQKGFTIEQIKKILNK